VEFDPPIFGVQRLANGYWLLRAPMSDPLLPAPVGEQTIAVALDA
jgi:hypothetical protein